MAFPFLSLLVRPESARSRWRPRSRRRRREGPRPLSRSAKERKESFKSLFLRPGLVLSDPDDDIEVIWESKGVGATQARSENREEKMARRPRLRSLRHLGANRCSQKSSSKRLPRWLSFDKTSTISGAKGILLPCVAGGITRTT